MSDNNYPPEVKKKYYCVAGVYESEYAAVGHVAAIRRAGFKSEVMDAIDYRDTALESIATSLAELVKILPTLNLAAPTAEPEAKGTELSSMIAMRRKDLGMSQVTLAKLVGITSGAVCRFENTGKGMSQDNVDIMCRVLNITEEDRKKCE
jgi:DNA-binding XRE family transcriptional regulator